MTTDTATTTQDHLFCPHCGQEARGDGNGESATVSGWHGDIWYGWGRYAGVYLCKPTGARCASCCVEWSTYPNWD